MACAAVLAALVTCGESRFGLGGSKASPASSAPAGSSEAHASLLAATSPLTGGAVDPVALVRAQRPAEHPSVRTHGHLRACSRAVRAS